VRPTSLQAADVAKAERGIMLLTKLIKLLVGDNPSITHDVSGEGATSVIETIGRNGCNVPQNVSIQTKIC
jgi:ATP-dependent protease Clp ATPase subunit